MPLKEKKLYFLFDTTTVVTMNFIRAPVLKKGLRSVKIILSYFPTFREMDEIFLNIS